MKKTISIFSLTLALVMLLTGCSSQKYTTEEQTYIDLANKVIEEKYDIKIIKDDYKYSVGKEVSAGNFDKIAEGETPEIISVSALSKKQPKEGVLMEYSLIYNTKTQTIISSDMALYEGSVNAN